MAAAATGNTELLIGWADAIKLAVPFVTAILLVWIKQWIEGRLARQRKQQALWHVAEELSGTRNTVLALKGVARSAQLGRLRLMGFTTPVAWSTLARELVDLDPSHADKYADLDAWGTIVGNGLERLAGFQTTRASAALEVVPRLDRVIFGQARVTASDSVSLSEAAIAVLDILPLGGRGPIPADRTLDAMKQVVADARLELSTWTRFDVPLFDDGEVASIAAATSAGPPLAHPPMLPRLQQGDDDYLDAGG